LSSSAERELKLGLQHLGIAGAGVAERLAAFGQLVILANRRTNLVGVASFGGLVPHLLDSLTPLASLTLIGPAVDVGSGAGLPGIAAAIVFPSIRFTLLEPRAKRAEFLDQAVAELELVNVQVRKMTAETAGRGALRSTFRTATARALAKPVVALELALPLLAIGGRLVLYTGRRAAPGTNEAAIITLAGGSLEEAKRIVVPYLDAQRHAWIVRKIGASPHNLPRRSGTPPKRGPLPD
jgi:16S rRNA (guanine527-N7)-methyltransferase